ncbi:NAD(P)H-binding protein [Streptomyces sp. BPTC-684]|uniref:NAD(P)H-binding protein n=1 Tax=Streptomyces sp. BPTC-684 TaxID=3043734 RepID=UPI0024B0B9E7|nr:NAD(P)H-binding protein [Streptomyces sp. BPTC-684]WHM35482.1 NAD(P)H-binding protein [Streptomyces sp. BPTC-684]
MTVFVIGAAGGLGQLVVRALRERDVEVAVLARDPERVPAGPGVRVVAGDLSDPASVRAAAEGCASLFLSASCDVECQSAAVDVAADVGARLVKMSPWQAAVREDSPAPGARHHWITERYLAKRDLPYTILSPNYPMQELIRHYAPEVRRRGVLVDPAGGRGVSVVDEHDVAEAAARVLTEPGHEGRTYALTGPAAPTFAQLAELLAGLLSAPVSASELAGPELAAWLAREHRPWEAELDALFGQFREGAGEPVTEDVLRVTGHEPRQVADFLKAHLHHFLPDSGG